MYRQLALVSVLALSLSACQTDGSGQKAATGALIGGVAGAIAGSNVGRGSGRIAAIATGTLLGAILGNQAGESLDRADRLALEHSTSEALETGTSGDVVTWKNPDSGNHGFVVPEPAYKNTAGLYCREFTQTIMIGSRTEEAYGTACRQPDGSWQLVN